MFKYHFYEFLVSNSTNYFIDLLTTWEQVEKRIKKGKIADTLTKLANPKKSSIAGKKK